MILFIKALANLGQRPALIWSCEVTMDWSIKVCTWLSCHAVLPWFYQGTLYQHIQYSVMACTCYWNINLWNFPALPSLWTCLANIFLIPFCSIVLWPPHWLFVYFCNWSLENCCTRWIDLLGFSVGPNWCKDLIWLGHCKFTSSFTYMHGFHPCSGILAVPR